MTEPECEPDADLEALLVVFGNLTVGGDLVVGPAAAARRPPDLSDSAAGAALPLPSPPASGPSASAPSSGSDPPLRPPLRVPPSPASGPSASDLTGVRTLRNDRPTVSATDWPARLSRARIAGEQASLKVAGVIQRVAPTPSLDLQNRVYVLVRPGLAAVARCVAAEARGYASSWASFRSYVETVRGEIDSAAVFHAFAGHAEAQAYWREATGLDPPIPLLR